MDWDPEALYFDPSANRHYGEIINDHWKPDENSCEIRWNEETKRVEVWSLVPIPLYKELETNYNDPYRYRTNNGLMTLEQATQVRENYGRKLRGMRSIDPRQYDYRTLGGHNQGTG